MTIQEPICFNCKYYNSEAGSCPAFPVRIPEIIYSGPNKHLKPLKRQKNDIVFDPGEYHGPPGRSRVEPKRKILDPISIGNKTVHFHQDPMIFMTVNYGPKGGKASDQADNN